MKKLGADKFMILQESSEDTTYEFPEDLKAGISQKYKGQTLSWFLMKFDSGVQPDLNAAQDKEFQNFKWVDWTEACELVVDWKKEVYEIGFSNLGFK